MKQQMQLAKRLEEVILNGKWIANTNFRAQILEMDEIKATERWQSCNSIAMLTFHLNYYIAGILNVFNTGELTIRDQFSFDMPSIANAEDWRLLKQALFDNTRKLVEIISQMNDELLDKDFVDPKYGSYRRNIDGLIEHCYYHLGQVVLLRKMMAN